MNVLRKCSMRSLQKSKRRTVITIVGIALATALLTAFACFMESFRQAAVRSELRDSGNFHYCFQGMAAKDVKIFSLHQHVEGYGLLRDEGYAMFKESKNQRKPYVHVCSLDEDCFERLFVTLYSGRLPQSEEEIIINRAMRSEGGSKLGIGDKVTLELGRRYRAGDQQEGPGLSFYEEYEGDEVLVPIQTKTYVIVGTFNEPSDYLEVSQTPGYTALTLLTDVGGADRLDVYARYDRKGIYKNAEVTAGILGVQTSLMEKVLQGKEPTKEEEKELTKFASGILENYWLIGWEKQSFSNLEYWTNIGLQTLEMLAVMLLGVACIQNSFEISLTEKLAFYGQIASVGATKRQRRMIVLWEALFVGGIGISAGILAGLLGSYGAMAIIKSIYAVAGIDLEFYVSGTMLLGTILFSTAMVWLSAVHAARRAEKITPISAIRGSDQIKKQKRVRKCPFYVKKLFGISGILSWKNYRRTRGKYGRVIFTIFLSVSLAIGFAEFSNLPQDLANMSYGVMGYQIMLTTNAENGRAWLEEVAMYDGVEEYTLFSSLALKVAPQSIPYLDLSEHTARDFETIVVYVLDDECMKKYCAELDVPFEDTDQRVIVRNQYLAEEHIDGKEYLYQKEISNLHDGDVIPGDFYFVKNGQKSEEIQVSFSVLKVAEAGPVFLRNMTKSSESLQIFVSASFLHKNYPSMEMPNASILLNARDADEVEKRIMDSGEDIYYLSNFAKEAQTMKEISLMLYAMIWGILGVSILIGLTNLMNTVNANMDARKREFSMLRSLGMTRQEQNRMLAYETLFMSSKALLPGIAMGIMLSYVLHASLGAAVQMFMPYRVPILAILLCILLTYFTLYAVMRQNAKNLDQENLLELLRKETA
ncbi:MAG: ABC transporter permease [Acetatifactor sp.]|nr:ABC transporter permease [Acetatifactor sp.]